MPSRGPGHALLFVLSFVTSSVLKNLFLKVRIFLPWPNTTLKSGFSVTSRLTRSPSGLVSWTWGPGRPPAGGGQGGRGAVGPPRPYHARRRTRRRCKEAWGRGAGRAHAGGFSVGTCGVRGSAFAPWKEAESKQVTGSAPREPRECRGFDCNLGPAASGRACELTGPVLRGGVRLVLGQSPGRPAWNSALVSVTAVLQNCQRTP